MWNIYLSCIVNISIAFDFGFYNWIVWFYIQILLIIKINRHPKTYDCVDFDTFHQNPKIGKRFAFDGKIFEIFVMLILNHFWLKPQCNIELYDVIICRHWNWSLLKIFVLFLRSAYLILLWSYWQVFHHCISHTGFIYVGLYLVYFGQISERSSNDENRGWKSSAVSVSWEVIHRFAYGTFKVSSTD